MVFGVFVAHAGYPGAFALTGVLILTALLPAVRDRGGLRSQKHTKRNLFATR